MTSDVTVYVVDDDEAVRHSLSLLLQSVKLNVKACESAGEFLDCYDAARPGCLILDVRMPEMSGLQLQRVLKEKAIQIPTIIITGHGDVPLTVRAMKEGAVDVIEKPFNNQSLLDSVIKAINISKETHQKQTARANFLKRVDRLSLRERQVMSLLVQGNSSKEIASKLSISSKTVDVHRNHIMDKMGVKTLVELVHMSVNHEP